MFCSVNVMPTFTHTQTQGDLLFGMHVMAPFELKPNDKIFILMFTAVFISLGTFYLGGCHGLIYTDELFKRLNVELTIMRKVCLQVKYV